MATKEEVNYGTTYNKAFKYSQAIKKGQIVTISGQVAWSKDGNMVGKGNFQAQAEQAIELQLAVDGLADLLQAAQVVEGVPQLVGRQPGKVVTGRLVRFLEQTI